MEAFKKVQSGETVSVASRSLVVVIKDMHLKQDQKAVMGRTGWSLKECIHFQTSFTAAYMKVRVNTLRDWYWKLEAGSDWAVI